MDEVTPIASRGNHPPKPLRRSRSQKSIERTKAHQELARQAYELRAGGKLPSEIAELLGLNDYRDVHQLLENQYAEDASYLTSMERQNLLGMQFMRLEKLLAAVWPAAMMGDPKSVHEAGEIVMKEARITGLEQIDPVVNKNLVLVMGEKEEDYIAALKATNSD
jgi:hypothetical protein